MAAPDRRNRNRHDDTPAEAATASRGRREEDSEHAAAAGPVIGKRRQDVLRRFRRPLIGLGLAGMSLPMVQATTASRTEEPADTDSPDPATAATAGGDVEENLVNRI